MLSEQSSYVHHRCVTHFCGIPICSITEFSTETRKTFSCLKFGANLRYSDYKNRALTGTFASPFSQ